jgi:hypothetical protein
MTRTSDVKVEFKWDGTNWTNESTNFMTATGAHELVAPADAYQSGKQVIQQCQVTLANQALRYSIENTASPIYAYIQDGQLYQTPFRLSINIDSGGWEYVFVGYIKLPRYDYVRNTVTFTVWDIGELLRKKYSTAMLENYLEHEVIIHYLELAGLTDGVDFVSPEYHAANPGTPATIEYSTTPIPYSWLDDEPVWGEIIDISQASGARVYVDRKGRVHYEKATLWAMGYAYTPETLTNHDMAAFTPEYDDKAFFDAVVVEYTERAPGSGGEELWKLTKPKVILAGQTENIITRLRYPAITLDAMTANDTYYLTDIAGNDVTGTVTPTLTPQYAQQATINITNSLSYAIVLSQASLTGLGIHGQPTEQYQQDITTPVYGRQIDVRGNPYLQTRLQAEGVAQFVAWWYEALKPKYTIQNVSGLATREIGQRIELEWIDTANGVTHSEICIITKIDWSIVINKVGAVAFAQNIQAIKDTFGAGDYFIIGTSTLGGPAVLWY